MKMEKECINTSQKIPIETLGDLRYMVSLGRTMIFELIGEDETPEKIECALLDPKRK